MATVPVTAENFEKLVETDGILLIDFWASWCGPCRSFKPIYEAAAEKHEDIVFGSCDTEAQQQLAGALQIRSIPTVMAFRDGVLVFAQPGMLPADTLEELIRQVRALDMDAVRAEIAEKQTASA